MAYEIQLLKSLLLPDFPSGSSINYHDGLFYLVGDDANSILILDKAYTAIGSVQLFNFPEQRIPKTLKADLEASVFITLSGFDYLLMVGSASREQREKVILIPFAGARLNKALAFTISTTTFISRLRSLGIAEVNIEGATAIGENLVLSNRGNRTNTTNHIILTSLDFFHHQDEVAIKIIPLKIGILTDDILGISEIYHERETDKLLISFSSEHTDNAYDDGTIGDSYLGWIDTITTKIETQVFTVEKLINLSQVHSDFVSEKIEGICVEFANREEMMVHLISDNDTGQSKLFKIRLRIE